MVLSFVTSNKFLHEGRTLTISSHGMHDWSRTDLTWQRNWKGKRGEVSCLRGPYGPSSMGEFSPQARTNACPCSFSWQPGQAVLCSAQMRSARSAPGVKHQADRKQLQGTTANWSLYVLAPVIHDPSHGDRVSWPLPVRFHCWALCIAVHHYTSCASVWSLLKGDTRGTSHSS